MFSFRVLLGAFMALNLAACASVENTRAEAAQLSTYRLCLRLAAPGLMASGRDLETWRETVESRGQDCSAYQADMDRAAQRQNATLQSLTTRLNQQPQQRAPQVQPAPPGTAFYQRSFRQGNSLICVYDRLGSPVYVTRQVTDICPLNTD